MGPFSVRKTTTSTNMDVSYGLFLIGTPVFSSVALLFRLCDFMVDSDLKTRSHICKSNKLERHPLRNDTHRFSKIDCMVKGNILF